MCACQRNKSPQRFVLVCMRIRSVFECIVFLALALAVIRPNVVASATNETKSAAPLWGDLAPGPYQVGFRTLFRFDASRTWRGTRDYKGIFSPDPDGRPVQINVCCPAVAKEGMRRMRFAAYVDQTSPDAFLKFNA